MLLNRALEVVVHGFPDTVEKMSNPAHCIMTQKLPKADTDPFGGGLPGGVQGRFLADRIAHSNAVIN